MYFNIFLFISLLAWLLLRYLQLKYVNTLSGDSITHLLFHNLVKNNKEYNPAGVVGVGRLNLPIVRYRISSFFMPKYEVGKSGLLPSINVIILLAIELILFGVLYIQSNDAVFSLSAVLAFALFPAFGLAATTEAGSYMKFSERMPALFANGLLASLLIGALNFGWLINYALLIFSFYFSCVLGKFARQVVVMIIIGFLVINLRSDYIIVMCLVLILLIMRQDFRGEVLAQLKYLATYKQFQLQNFEVSEKRLSELGIPSILTHNRYFRMYSRLFLHSGLNIILCLPTIIYLLTYGTHEAQLLVGFTFAISILTTTHVFYFLGPGFRYIYNVLPVLLMTEMSYGQNVHFLLYANVLISIASITKNYKVIFSKIEFINNKILAYRMIQKKVRSDSTIFFDHYKDAEIFQLLSSADLKTKVSTSQDYAWTLECKKIFLNYPLVDLSEPTLTMFNVSYIISLNSELEIDGFENIYRFGDYSLYELTRREVTQ